MPPNRRRRKPCTLRSSARRQPFPKSARRCRCILTTKPRRAYCCILSSGGWWTPWTAFEICCKGCTRHRCAGQQTHHSLYFTVFISFCWPGPLHCTFHHLQLSASNEKLCHIEDMSGGVLLGVILAESTVESAIRVIGLFFAWMLP